MACPWADIKQQEPVSFIEIMSEEIIKYKQLKKEEYVEKEFMIVNKNGEIVNELVECIENDETVAQLLQFEFDKEYEESSKGTLEATDSVNNFQNEDSESDEGNIELSSTEDCYNCNDFEANDTVPLEDYKIKQHNSVLCDKVSNDLKRLSHDKKNKKYALNNKKDQLMAEVCRNEFVETLVGHMLKVTGVIDYGRDSIIFHADSNPSFPRSLPKECVVKVHKSILSEFKQREKYVKDGHFFKDKFNKQLTNATFQRKAQREKAILKKLRKTEVKCPEVVALNNGVLVTTFIGINKKPAPKLKDVDLTEYEACEAFNKVIYYLHKMYNANIIHGGLSEHSVLWYNKTCYIVNFSHCVERSDPEAFNFLFRDCTNIIIYFRNKYKFELCPPDFFFQGVVGHSFKDKEKLEKLRESFKNKND